MPAPGSAPRLEISAFSVASALAARHSAHRIELCSGPRSLGGLTPAAADLHALQRATSLPIYVMIRPRADTFAYPSSDVASMVASIAAFRALARHPEGFVLGALTAGGRVDAATCAELVRAAAPLPCTFHRAFDEVGDRAAALEALVDAGFAAVLTAGGTGGVRENAAGLADTVARAGGRIEVVAGGGVRSANLRELASMLGGDGPAYWHSAALLGDSDEVLADADEVAALRHIVDRLRAEGGRL